MRTLIAIINYPKQSKDFIEYVAAMAIDLQEHVHLVHINNPNNLNSLAVIQKRAIRNICLLKYREHTAHFFSKLNLLQIEDIGLLQVSQFMY